MALPCRGKDRESQHLVDRSQQAVFGLPWILDEWLEEVPVHLHEGQVIELLLRHIKIERATYIAFILKDSLQLRNDLLKIG